MQRQHDRGPRRRGDFLEMHHAEHGGKNGARDDAEQHGDIGDEAGAPFDQAEDHQQHEQRNAKALQLAVGGIWESVRHAIDHFGQGRQAAAGPVDADPHQGNADHQDDGAGDDGRK